MVLNFLRASAKLLKASIGLITSVCPSAWVISTATRSIFMYLDYVSIFRKSVQQIQVLLKSDMNNGYFTRIPVNVCDNTSVDHSQNEKCFRQTKQSNQNTCYVQWIFFLKRTVYEVIWKDSVKPDRHQTAI